MKTTEREDQLLEVAKRAGRKASFYVAPRYTAGSPGLVDIGLCVHVAAQEEEAIAENLTGLYGDEAKAKAEKLGLANIAYARWEKKRKVIRLDILTGEEFGEPPRLEWKEVERLKELRNWSGYMKLEQKTELASLEARIALHRQTL